MAWFGDYNLTPVENTSRGQFYKTSAQAIPVGATPTTNTLTFQAATSWSDTGTSAGIVLSTPTTFLVQKKGVYVLDAQITYGISGSAVFGDNTHFCNIRLTRGANASTISSVSSMFAGWVSTLPSTRAIQAQAIFELQVGDLVSVQSVDFLTAGTGSFNISSRSAAPFDYDYNTYFSWSLIKELA